MLVSKSCPDMRTPFGSSTFIVAQTVVPDKASSGPHPRAAPGAAAVANVLDVLRWRGDAHCRIEAGIAYWPDENRRSAKSR